MPPVFCGILPVVITAAKGAEREHQGVRTSTDRNLYCAFENIANFSTFYSTPVTTPLTIRLDLAPDVLHITVPRIDKEYVGRGRWGSIDELILLSPYPSLYIIWKNIFFHEIKIF